MPLPLSDSDRRGRVLIHIAADVLAPGEARIAQAGVDQKELARLVANAVAVL
jgi:hypothetical protein